MPSTVPTKQICKTKQVTKLFANVFKKSGDRSPVNDKALQVMLLNPRKKMYVCTACGGQRVWGMHRTTKAVNAEGATPKDAEGNVIPYYECMACRQWLDPNEKVAGFTAREMKGGGVFDAEEACAAVAP